LMLRRVAMHGHDHLGRRVLRNVRL